MPRAHRTTVLIAFFLAMALVLTGCPKPRPPQAALDTPFHHVQNGHKLLEKGRVQDAVREFEMARELDRKYAPAYSGLGLASAMSGDYKGALEYLQKAGKYEDGDEQEAEVAVSYIRLYTLAKEGLSDRWLSKAKDWYDRAQDLTPGDPAPYYYMGMAYKSAYEFTPASQMFKKVIDLDGKFMAQADKEYAEIQKIERAMPGTQAGRRIALLDSLNRADAAALFIQELGLDRLFEERAKKTMDTGWRPPDKPYVTETVVKAEKVTDIGGHVLENDIQAVVDLDIRGLRPYADHTFQPDKPITRAEYALMMEDILVRLTGDDTLATRFIASPSPFPDVRNDVSYFNAVMVATSRNIMKPKDLATGEFDPMGPVSGADALIGIRQMKSLLNR